MRDDVAEAIKRHRSAGRAFSANGVRSFVREEGSGPAVVMVHGVPTSSFLYRKIMGPLAEAGFRAIAFDFPGLGLADRPRDFDYSWSGLARWIPAALDALEIERCHLVVHDVGGPIGCEAAIRNPERVQSLTALNCMLGVGSFRRPWVMAPFAIRGLGELYLRTTPRFAASELFYRLGMQDRSATPRDEVHAYQELLRLGDRGRAFLRIMRGFELTDEKERFLRDGLAERPYPAQIVWGENDRTLGRSLDAAIEILRVERPLLLPAKHFLQEDQAPAVADAIARFAVQSSGN
jgi:haloalkane dehalogenase